jgi:hypothetical protein
VQLVPYADRAASVASPSSSGAPHPDARGNPSETARRTETAGRRKDPEREGFMMRLYGEPNDDLPRRWQSRPRIKPVKGPVFSASPLAVERVED